ncbi:MAG: hypothetical protein A2X84_03140 [Desulfuromonadaceae bacterium GWC2_58_13]|nr:MAG: hypothetical protein A2X84_03140 [Desulfuromonadaceae bacterium GWC2_58_13]
MVILTGQGDEQVAVEAIKRGALDYVVKSMDSFADLPYIVERSRREWRRIVDHRRAVRKAAEFGGLLDASLNEIYTFDAETLHFLQINRGALKNLGYSMDELRQFTPLDIKPEFSWESFETLLQPLRSKARETATFYSSHRRKDGSCYPVEVHLQLLTLEERPVFVAMVLDISDRKRAEDALKLSEERFRSIFESAASGVVMISPDGVFKQVNPAFIRFVGYEEAELLKMSVFDVTHPEDREWTRGYYQLLAGDQNRIVDTEKRYLRKDGTVFWGHTSVACVFGGEGTEEYCVGLVQDITERKRMEEQLQELNRELDAFVCTVSHDLRTPLTPIVGYAQYLKSAYADKLDAKALDLLGEIDRQGQVMAAMIEDLLNLAKVGALKLPDEPLEVSQVVSELLDVMASQIAESGVEIRVEDFPRVRLPRTLLNQIFDNLIGNALRYAGGGGGPIEVGGLREKDRVRLFVRDHGPGIPEEEREKIFEAFFRGTSGKSRRGTGIGLATIKKIARLFGGRAWVEETPGGGATFWVELVG